MYEKGKFAMDTILLNVLIGIQLVVSAGAQPDMEVSEVRLVIGQGKTAILPCMVTGMDTAKYRITWFGPDRNRLSVNNRLVTSDRRYRLSQHYVTDWNLVLENVRGRDAGSYRCHLNTVPGQEKHILLEVQVPPRIKSSDHTEVLLGTSLTLFCNVTGDPKPTIRWFKESTQLVGENAESIYIPNVSMADDGNYRCEAANVADIDTATISVTVQYPPEVRVVPERLGQYRRLDVVLYCSVRSYPTATIDWYRENTRLQPTWKYRFSNYSSEGAVHTHSFTIKYLEPQDYGDYICMGSNIAGSRSAVVELYEMETPTTRAKPNIPKTTAKTDDSDVTKTGTPPLVVSRVTVPPLYNTPATKDTVKNEENGGTTGQISDRRNAGVSVQSTYVYVTAGTITTAFVLSEVIGVLIGQLT